MFTHNPHSAHKILNVPASPEYWLFQLMANRRFHSFELAGDILLTMTTETWKQIIFVKADTKIQTIGSSINNVCIQCADTIYRWMLGYVDGWYSIKHPFLQSCFHTHLAKYLANFAIFPIRCTSLLTVDSQIDDMSSSTSILKWIISSLGPKNWWKTYIFV